MFHSPPVGVFGYTICDLVGKFDVGRRRAIPLVGLVQTVDDAIATLVAGHADVVGALELIAGAAGQMGSMQTG